MKILVTGSSGTIGTRLCEKLLEARKSVHGVDWVKNKWQPSVDAITTIVDLRDDAAIEKNAKNLQADIIVHLAANARVYELVEEPVRARDNFVTLFNTLEFARQHGIKKFIFASSREGYGNIHAESYSEDMVRIENCESPYTASKVGGEALVHAYARCYGIETIIFRFSNVYGMYDDSNRVIPLFFRLARDKKPLTVFGEGKCLDFTYIDDTVDAVMASIEKFDEAKGETFNLGNGAGHTILALAEEIQELLKVQVPIEMKPSRIGEVTKYIADITKAKKVLGYTPVTPFSEGIKKTVEWYVKHT